jgi:5'-AMP-activated protein kinase regulatory beta subunit
VVAGDERISVVFSWTHGGQNVFLAASFNGWREQIPMVRSGNDFQVVHELPRGVHQYKFIVDDQWRFSPDQPKTQDTNGNMNNVCDVSAYQHFQVDVPDEATPRYSHVIPAPDSYMQDAPAVPTVLGKSAFCAVEKWSQGLGQPPHIPTHSICDHVYIWQGAVNVKEPTQLAVTHRYGKRYSTTVFATNRDHAEAQQGSPDAAVARSSRNLLKGALRRRAPGKENRC